MLTGLLVVAWNHSITELVMYFEDLGPFVNIAGENEPDSLAIGWLDHEHPFTKGRISESMLNMILMLCLQPTNRTRGYHQSPFLVSSTYGYKVECSQGSVLLGSGEIRVEGCDGKMYIAPDLIYHYIKDCGYLPPQAFLDAVFYSYRIR